MAGYNPQLDHRCHTHYHMRNIYQTVNTSIVLDYFLVSGLCLKGCEKDLLWIWCSTNCVFDVLLYLQYIFVALKKTYAGGRFLIVFYSNQSDTAVSDDAEP